MEELGKEEIEKLYKLSNCNMCGDCLDEATGCQFLGYDHERAVKEVTALIEGRDTPVLEDCITCQACQTFCPNGVNIFNWIIHRMDTEKTWIAPGLDRLNLYGLLPGLEKPWVMQKGDPDKPWVSVCLVHALLGPPGDIEMFKDSRIFKDLNLLGGTMNCLVGMTHAGLENATGSACLEAIKGNIDMYNTFCGGKEIIFSHDECIASLWQGEEQGLEVPFKHTHIVQYLNEYLKANKKDIKPLGLKVAHDSNCSIRYGPSREAWFDEFYELIGCTRVERRYDRENQLCCMPNFLLHRSAGAPERGVLPDVERAADARKRNVDDAVAHGATHMAFICPGCMGNMVDDCLNVGLVPVNIIELAQMAFGERKARW